MTHCIAVHPNGRVYTVPWIESRGKAKGTPGPEQQVDLISIADPLRG